MVQYYNMLVRSSWSILPLGCHHSQTSQALTINLPKNHRQYDAKKLTLLKLARPRTRSPSYQTQKGDPKVSAPKASSSSYRRSVQTQSWQIVSTDRTQVSHVNGTVSSQCQNEPSIWLLVSLSMIDETRSLHISHFFRSCLPANRQQVWTLRGRNVKPCRILPTL